MFEVRCLSEGLLRRGLKLREPNLEHQTSNIKHSWPRSTMDSIRVSEAPDTGSIPVEATFRINQKLPEIIKGN